MPVGEVVGPARIKPQAKLDSRVAGGVYYRLQAVGGFFGRGFPVVGVRPDVEERAAVRRISAFANLPAVVDLEVRYAHLFCACDFPLAESFVYFRVLPSVAPSVEHDHFVAPLLQAAEVLLVRPQREQAFALAAVPDAEDVAVRGRPFVGGDVRGVDARAHEQELTPLRKEVRRWVRQLHERHRRLFQPEEARARLLVFHEQNVAPQGHFAVGQRGDFADEVVVVVGNVEKFGGEQIPLPTRERQRVERERGLSKAPRRDCLYILHVGRRSARAYPVPRVGLSPEIYLARDCGRFFVYSENPLYFQIPLAEADFAFEPTRLHVRIGNLARFEVAVPRFAVLRRYRQVGRFCRRLRGNSRLFIENRERAKLAAVVFESSFDFVVADFKRVAVERRVGFCENLARRKRQRD